MDHMLSLVAKRAIILCRDGAPDWSPGQRRQPLRHMLQFYEMGLARQTPAIVGSADVSARNLISALSMSAVCSMEGVRLTVEEGHETSIF